MLKTKYILYDLKSPYFRGIPDILSIIYNLKKFNSKTNNNKKERGVIILSCLTSFIYHKIKMKSKAETFISILDNYFIALRCYIGSNLILKTKWKEARLFSFFLSTIFLFDYKKYVKRKYCYLPFIFSLLCIRNVKEFMEIFPFVYAFLFFLIEYYIILPFDLGKYLRNNQYFSNHEIFHIIIYISENIYLNKIKL